MANAGDDPGLRPRARDILARSVVAAAEGTSGLTAESMHERPIPIRERLQRSEAWINGFIEQLGDVGPDLYEVRDQLLADARRGLDRISSEGPDAPLDRAAEVGLEAIIETDGSRPVFIVQDDQLDANALAVADQWQTLLSSRRSEIAAVTQAVGRVNDPAAAQRFQGTAFAVAPGLVMTNRHVLQAIASNSSGSWVLKPGITIDFAREYKRPRTRELAVKEVVFAGPKPVNIFAIDHDILDVALLRIENGDAGRPWPLPLPIVIRPEAHNPSRTIVACGFPGDPHTDEPADLKLKLFNLIFTYKILAPGRVKRTAGELAHNARKWSIGHDATTLPGNSGSCLIDIEAGAEVVALHYAGSPRVINYAHVLGLVGDEPVPNTGKSLLEFLRSEGAAIRE
jgi:hypothetical protein